MTRYHHKVMDEHDSAACNRLPLIQIVAGLIFSVTTAASAAQINTTNAVVPVERNTPPVVNTSSPVIGVPNATVINADNRALGVNLEGIHLIGPQEQPSTHIAKGITVGEIGPGGDLKPELDRILRPLIGRPLSMSLIADAQAAIARVYRKAGYPFVSVTIPPQEITQGIVNLRVIEFRVGSVTTRGTAKENTQRLASQIRAANANRIASASVNEDLAWLNRSPFRRVQGLFASGSATGYSDLILDVTGSKPWQVYGGYSNTGTRETDRNRFFLGGGFALPGIDGAYGTYQLTGSSDLFEDLGRLFPDHADQRAQYLSHAARFVVPLEGRQAIDFSPSYIATRQTNSGFTFDNTVIELPLYYRSALSNIVPGVYGGEIYTGIEYKRLSRDSLLSGIQFGNAQAEIIQFGLGWTQTFADSLGSTTVDAHMKINPGGIVGDNTSRVWNAYSNGAVTDSHYAYLAGSLTRSTDVGAGFLLTNELTFQLAGQSLPDTERLSLGGLDAVRGYELSDAVADTGVIIRNELRAPTLSPTNRDRLSPFTFIDIGFGQDKTSSTGLSVAGSGIGLDYSVAQNLSLNATAAFALISEGSRDAGDIDLKIRLTARY